MWRNLCPSLVFHLDSFNFWLNNLRIEKRSCHSAPFLLCPLSLWILCGVPFRQCIPRAKLDGSNLWGASSQLEEQILEIPLNAPYLANQEDFQATNTRFELEGNYYRAIKQRYQNDTLQVVYVPDTARQVLDVTVKKWISALAEDQLPQDQEASNLGMQFAKDYLGTGLLSFEGMSSPKFTTEIGFIFSTYLSPSFILDSPPPQHS